MSQPWLTPEEMERKRERNKLLTYVFIPIITVIISVAVTLLLSNL